MEISLHIPSHKAMLVELWTKANLPKKMVNGEKFGFITGAPKWEIQRIGYLGLISINVTSYLTNYKCLTNYLARRRRYWNNTIDWQNDEHRT